MMTKKPGPWTSLLSLGKTSSSSSLQVVMLQATMAALKPISSKAISASPMAISACHILSTEGKL